MCYLCKYKEYHYNNGRYTGQVHRFIQYIHTHEVPITELYTARTRYMKRYTNYRGEYRRTIRGILNTFIHYVEKKENISIQDDVPTYHMNQHGQYTRVR